MQIVCGIITISDRAHVVFPYHATLDRLSIVRAPRTMLLRALDADPSAALRYAASQRR